MESNIADYRYMLARMLGPRRFSIYLEAMRDLLGQKMTKETFDIVMSPHFNGDAIVIHNLMMLEILKMCNDDVKHCPDFEVDDQEIEIVPPEVEKVEEFPEMLPVTVYEFEPGDEVNFPVPDLSKRFSAEIGASCQEINSQCGTDPELIPNVNVLYNIDEQLQENSAMKDYFCPPKEGEPFTSDKATLYGKCFIKAWSMGCQHIEIAAVDTAADFTYEHIKVLIAAMISQRKPFRRKRKTHGGATLVGDPYPNPYLYQGYHSYETFNRPEILTCAEALHVPDHISTMDERERLSVLRVSAECPEEPMPYKRPALTMLELLAAVKGNERLIPNQKMKVKLMTEILEKVNGNGASNSYAMGRNDATDSTNFDLSDDEEDEGELLPTSDY